MDKKLDLIFSRRSVRRFTGEPLTDEQLKALLEAGMAAPSACCRDPWEFVIVRDKAALKKAGELLTNGPFIADAGAGIIVCGNPADAHAESLSFLIQDCSAVIENMLLAAPALGLGGCWLGIHPRVERIAALQEMFNIPSEMLVIGIAAIGVPSETPAPRTRYNEAVVHDGCWGNKIKF